MENSIQTSEIKNGFQGIEMILQALCLSMKVSETKNLWSSELTQSYPHLQYHLSKV